MILTSNTKPIRPLPSIAKACAVLGGVLYLFVAFLTFVRAQTAVEPTYTLPIVAGLLPIAAFVALRFPMIFPFGLYVALVPFDSLLQVSGGGATIGRLVAIATAGTMILHALLLRRAFVPHRAYGFWALMTLYLGASLLWTADPANGLVVALTVLQLFLFMTILAMYPATKTEFMIALWFVILCGVLAAGYAIQQYLTGQVSGGDSTRVDIAFGGKYAIDFNYFAASFILPIAVATCFTFYAKHPLAKVTSGVATLVLMAGLLVTGSRGAFIAAIAIFIYFGIRSKFRLQVASLVGAIFAVSLLFPSVYARFANDPSGQQGSASGRTFIWQTGLYHLREHVFFGTGVGSFATTYDRNFLDVYQAAFQGWSRPSHSILVGGLTELGIVGLGIVLAAWFMSFRQLRLIPKTSEWFGLRLAFEGAVVALFAMSLSIDPTYIKYIWLAHALALMLLNQEAPRVIRLQRSAPHARADPVAIVAQIERGVSARAR